jgi:hypothetical protein
MTLAALLTVVWIAITPCNVPHPPDLTCREYARHLAAERAYVELQNETEVDYDCR